MQINLVSIGFGSVIHAERLIAILNAESAPIRRKIQEARESGLLVDASYGRKTRSVLIMDSGQVILSAILPETITARVEGRTPILTVDEKSMSDDEGSSSDNEL